MFTKSQIKQTPNTLAQKRQQFHKQIRRNYLQQIFTEKRKQFSKQLNQMQRNKYQQQFSSAVNQTLKSTSKQQAQKSIQLIYNLINEQNGYTRQILVKFCQNLLKIFIMFPKNNHNLQILYLIVVNVYEHTFQQDNTKFKILYKQQWFSKKIQKKSMTVYQQCSDVLLKTLDEEILKLSLRRSQNYIHSQQQQLIANRFNNQIQRKVRFYLKCLRHLSVNSYSFVFRNEYVYSYAYKWSKSLILDYEFCREQLLTYLIGISMLISPFISYVDEMYLQQSERQMLKMQEGRQEIEDMIVDRLFQYCVPSCDSIKTEPLPFLSMNFLKTLFSFTELKIQKMIKYLQKLMHLVKTVLNLQQYFRNQSKNRVFQLIIAILQRFTVQKMNVDTSQQKLPIINQINVVQILRNMEFIHSFDLYLKIGLITENQPIFQIVHSLVNYVYVFGYNMDLIFQGNHLLNSVIQGLDCKDHFTVRQCINTIVLICQYTQKINNKQYCVKMLNSGIDRILDSLVYHTQQWIRTVAIQLTEFYFSQNKIYDYTQLNSQLKRYQNQIMSIEQQEKQILLPDKWSRYEMYQT